MSSHQELICIDCKTKIKKDPLLVTDGKDCGYICEDCGYTDDDEEYEWKCQCGCGTEVNFTRGCMNGTVIQLYEMEYWLKDCAIKQLGIDTDICTECYERPCVGRCIGCDPETMAQDEKYKEKPL